MWDDTTEQAQKVARWLDAPMDLDGFYGKPTYVFLAFVLAAWLTIKEVPYWVGYTERLRGQP